MEPHINLEKTNFFIGLEPIIGGTEKHVICISQFVDHIEENEKEITATTSFDGIFLKYLPKDEIKALLEDGIKYRKIKEAEKLKNQ